MYAIALQDSRLCPVFYKQYPGSVRDVSAFMNMLREMGLKGALVITDKGFVKLSHLDELEANRSNITLTLLPDDERKKMFSTMNARLIDLNLLLDFLFLTR